MPYISPETVKVMRQRIKEALPGFKISVRTEHYSLVQVSIMKGPVDFGTKHEQLNPYHYNNRFADNPEAKAVIDTIMNIMNGVEQKKTEHEDGDYGSIPNYYQRVDIGKWDRPYELTV